MKFVELIVVLGILGLAFVFFLPALSELRSSVLLEATLRENTSSLRKAQAQAIGFSQRVYWEPKALPTIKPVASRVFCFSSSGFPTPGGFGTQVFATSFGKKKKIIVSSLGRIRIE